MPEIEEAAGRVLADRRRRAGLTQEELAFRCELHPTYISLLERGLKSPTLRVLFRLAAGLGESPATLVRAVERSLARPRKPKTPSAKPRVPRRGGTR